MLFTYGQSMTLVDDEEFQLLTMTVGMMGILIVGSDEERVLFSSDALGNVNLIIASANIAANANTDGKFCIGTAVQNPLKLKNRLGSSKVIMIALMKA